MDRKKEEYKGVNRREFVQLGAGALLTLGMTGIVSGKSKRKEMKQQKKIRIEKVDSNFEREALFPYRFKGSFISETWQTAAFLMSDSGKSKVGIGTQGTLWSDSDVFFSHSPNGGNALMYAMTERALQMMKGEYFTDPVSLLDDLLPEVYAYGKKITGNPDLKKTFALNALVPVDNAAWLLRTALSSLTRWFRKRISRAFPIDMTKWRVFPLSVWELRWKT